MNDEREIEAEIDEISKYSAKGVNDSYDHGYDNTGISYLEKSLRKLSSRTRYLLKNNYDSQTFMKNGDALKKLDVLDFLKGTSGNFSEVIWNVLASSNSKRMVVKTLDFKYFKVNSKKINSPKNSNERFNYLHDCLVLDELKGCSKGIIKLVGVIPYKNILRDSAYIIYENGGIPLDKVIANYHKGYLLSYKDNNEDEIGAKPFFEKMLFTNNSSKRTVDSSKFEFKTKHVIEIFEQVFTGLAYMGTRNLVHRDLRLRNILVRFQTDTSIDSESIFNAHAMLIDFNKTIQVEQHTSIIEKSNSVKSVQNKGSTQNVGKIKYGFNNADDNDDNDSSLINETTDYFSTSTETEIIVGPPAYLAPELLIPGKDCRASHKSDVYALSICFWMTLTGQTDIYDKFKGATVSRFFSP